MEWDDVDMEGSSSFTQLFFKRLRLGLDKRSQAISIFLDDGKKKNAIPVLDGVRAIACLAIITFHMNLLARFSNMWNPPLDIIGAFFSATVLFGESGVILFFVLSGFLLFLPYARSMLFDNPWPSVPRFYVRRVLRIVPGYYVALLLMLIFLAPEYFQFDHWYHIWLFVTFRMDFPPTFQKLNAPFWTLALEFQYYMVLPLIAWGMGFLVRRGSLIWRLVKLILCLFALVGWGIGTRYWATFMPDGGALSLFLSPEAMAVLRLYIYGTIGKYFEVFAIGMLVSTLYVYGKHISVGEHFAVNMRRCSPLIFLSGLGLLGFISLWHFYLLFPGKTLNFFDPYQAFLTNYKDMYQPLGYAISYGLCILALVYAGPRLRRPFEWNPLRWVGLISYSLYMWHYPIILFFLSTFLPKFQALNWNQPTKYLIFWLWILLTAFPLSIVLYRVIEVPGIRFGEKICQRLEGYQKRAESQTPIEEELSHAVPVALESKTSVSKRD
ncbi:hypothetical protein KDW_24190 [Dictyobacter vulcani]|uniref:Acyltransferase 3 domain-containing protein n=1 Tax=Dictyobacter vulcani TaxID=2607529 RepID=A0A5J4KP97_9CHLR|nr:acyltransferase [Dictyobacter vulcani]GER88257.1 hypothetical protein KDW_24190 [Dictyobacter vulcani]